MDNSTAYAEVGPKVLPAVSCELESWNDALVLACIDEYVSIDLDF